MVYYRENYTFPRIQRGSNILRGRGVQLFSSGVQMLISIETHIISGFPRSGKNGGKNQGQGKVREI